MSDVNIQAEMKEKHISQIHAPIPDPSSSPAAPVNLSTKTLKRILERLNRTKASGPNGLKPIPLSKLAGIEKDPNDRDSDLPTPLDKLAAFGNLYAQGRFPLYVYEHAGASSLTALVKKQATETAAADHRPVNCTNILFRTLDKAISREMSSQARGQLEPTNLGCGTTMGCESCILQAKLLLEVHNHNSSSPSSPIPIDTTDLFFVRIDLKNAHNSTFRAETQAALNSIPAFGPIRKLYNMKARAQTDCLARINSRVWEPICQMVEGGQQGGPLTGMTFMATIDPILKEFDQEDHRLRAIQDDILIMGKREKIFEILPSLRDKLRAVGGEIAEGPSKSCCFSPSGNYEGCPSWLTQAPEGFVFVGGFIGTRLGEEQHLESIVSKLERDIPEILQQFCSADGHTGYTVFRGSQQFRFDYFCRTTLPEIARPFVRRINDLHHQMLAKFGGFEDWDSQDGSNPLPNFIDDLFPDFRAAWMHQPCRLGGSGVPDKLIVAESAFVGAITDILSKFPAHLNKRGEMVRGQAEFLTPLFGTLSFDRASRLGPGNPAPDPLQRFAQFVATGLPTASAFKLTWQNCQKRREDLLERLQSPPDSDLVKFSPLCHPVEAAGAEVDPPSSTSNNIDEVVGPSHIQRAIMHEYSLLSKRCLDAMVRLLPPSDPRRLAYTNIFDRGQHGQLSDKASFSTVLFSSLPNAAYPFSLPEFNERFQNHFGLPCSLCRPLQGYTVGSRETVIDLYGLQVYNAVTKTRAAQRRQLHDKVQHVIARTLSNVGEHVMETPANFLTSGITLTPEQSLVLSEETALNKIIPDLVVHLDLHDSTGVYLFGGNHHVPCLIFDIKTINSTSRTATSSSSSTRDETSTTSVFPKRAVDKVADAVGPDYDRRLRKLDEKVFGTEAPHLGPYRSKLDELQAGKVRGLGFGRYGEASTEVHRLLKHAALRGSDSLTRHYPGRNSKHLGGIVKERLKREWGFCVHKGWVSLKIGILQQAKRVAAERSRSALQYFDSMREIEFLDEDIVNFASRSVQEALENTLAT